MRRSAPLLWASGALVVGLSAAGLAAAQVLGDAESNGRATGRLLPAQRQVFAPTITELSVRNSDEGYVSAADIELAVCVTLRNPELDDVVRAVALKVGGLDPDPSPEDPGMMGGWVTADVRSDDPDDAVQSTRGFADPDGVATIFTFDFTPVADAPADLGRDWAGEIDIYRYDAVDDRDRPRDEVGMSTFRLSFDACQQFTE